MRCALAAGLMVRSIAASLRLDVHKTCALRRVSNHAARQAAFDASSAILLSSRRRGGRAALEGSLFGVQAMMNPLLWLILTLIRIYIYVLIAAAVLSWLIAFNVVNSHNPTVRMIWDLFYRLTEPALRPIRAVIPNLGGIDVSPVILIIGLMFLEYVVLWLFG
jgi:YggT family protein